MEAFLAAVYSTAVSLGVLLLMYVCKRIYQKVHKRRILSMLPEQICDNQQVIKEADDVAKELSELATILAKYGYKLTYTISIDKVKEVS